MAWWWWLWYVVVIQFTTGNVHTIMLDLRGAKLNVSINVAFPFCNFKIVNNKIFKLYSIEFQLLELLESKFNFKTNLVYENQIWGDLVDGKHWNGVIGSVFNQTSQIGMCLISITHQRAEAVDFSSIVAYDYLTFMSKRPGLSSRKWIIFSPFNIHIWFLILLSFITLTITVHVSSRVIPPYSSISFQSILLNLAKIFLKQHIDGIHSQTRWFYFLWFLTALVLSNSYCGRFYSILALPEMEPPIDTVEDLLHLANEDKIMITTFKTASYLNYFLAARPETDKVYYQISENFKRNNPKLGEKFYDAVDMIEQSEVPMVFVNSRSLLIFSKIFFARQPLHIAAENLDNDFYAMAFAKQSPLYTPFNRVIQQSFEFGLTQHWARSVYYKTPGTSQNKLDTIEVGKQISSIRLQDLYSIFVCWIISNVIAYFIFLLEVLVFVLKQVC